MGLFSFLKPTKPVGFTYHARFSDDRAGKVKYYNEDKDLFMERLREVREQAESDDPENRKARIRRQLQRKNSLLADKKYRQQKVLRSNLTILLLIVGLVALTFAVLDIYLPRLLQFLGE
jgi:hypothetical protein